MIQEHFSPMIHADTVFREVFKGRHLCDGVGDVILQVQKGPSHSLELADPGPAPPGHLLVQLCLHISPTLISYTHAHFCGD